MTDQPDDQVRLHFGPRLSISAHREHGAQKAAERLLVALEAARIAVDLALNVRDSLGADAPADQVERRQLAVNQLLRASFDTLEVRARAACWSVYLLREDLDLDRL